MRNMYDTKMYSLLDFRGHLSEATAVVRSTPHQAVAETVVVGGADGVWKIKCLY